MTIHQTTAGKLHFAQRIADTSLTNAFAGVELGTGDTAIGTADTRSAMLNKIVGSLTEVEAGYPKINDTDVANTGRGADVWTYKFIVDASATGPFTATNFHLTNYAAGAPTATEPVGIVGNGLSITCNGTDDLTLFLNVAQ